MVPLLGSILLSGDTLHFDYIAETVATGLMSVQLATNVPCTFGVLTCLTEQQATDRSYGGRNHGIPWAKTAIEMAMLRQSALGLDKKGFLNLGFQDPHHPPENSQNHTKHTPSTAPKVGDKKIYF